jgi:Cobalamin-independent synthase, Catalytic domain
VVSDPGAVRDLTESLAEGLAAHLGAVARRVPGAAVVLQLDEPGVPAVLAGRVPTPSGYGTVRGVEAAVVEDRLRAALTVADAGSRVVHCCATDAPVSLFRCAGADALSLDLAQLDVAQNDALGEAVDAGASLWLGVVPSVDSATTFADARDRLLRWWAELGFARADAAAALVPTPACGLAGASPQYARRAMTLVRDVGRALQDETE